MFLKKTVIYVRSVARYVVWLPGNVIIVNMCGKNCVKFYRLKLFILIALLFSNVKIFLEPVPRNI